MVEQAYLPLVSRYFLDQDLQPSVAHLLSQMYSLWLHNLQDENEPYLYGLGMLLIQLRSHSSTPISTPCYHQNENVQRASTSERFVPDLRRPDRRTSMKELVKKMFHFVDDIRRAYVRWKITDPRYVVKPCTIIQICIVNNFCTCGT